MTPLYRPSWLRLKLAEPTPKPISLAFMDLALLFKLAAKADVDD